MTEQRTLPAGIVFLVEGEMGAALPVFMMLFGLIYLGAGVAHLSMVTKWSHDTRE